MLETAETWPPNLLASLINRPTVERDTTTVQAQVAVGRLYLVSPSAAGLLRLLSSANDWLMARKADVSCSWLSVYLSIGLAGTAVLIA